MSERTRRVPVKAVGSGAQAALAQLKAAREGGVKRVATFEFRKEEAVYDQLQEDEYEQVVAKRKAGGGFVVDDDGRGYEDDGNDEEHWNADRSDDEDDEGGADGQGGGPGTGKKRRVEANGKDAGRGGKKKGVGGVAGQTAGAAEPDKPAKRIESFFKAATARAVTNVHRSAPSKVTDECSDDILANLLSSIDPTAATPPKPTAAVIGRPHAPPAAHANAFGRSAIASAAQPPPRNSTLGRPGQGARGPSAGRMASNRPTATNCVGRHTNPLAKRPQPQYQPQPQQQQEAWDDTGAADGQGWQDGLEEEQVVDAADPVQDTVDTAMLDAPGAEDLAEGAAKTAAAAAADGSPAVALEAAAEVAAAATPAAAFFSKGASAATATPATGGTLTANNRLFAESHATPATPGGGAAGVTGAAVGWASMYDWSQGVEAVTPPPGESLPDGTPASAWGASTTASTPAAAASGRPLAVNADGLLPFYFVDAYENPETRPGEVFLFGKVQQDGAWQSCTALVKGLQYNLFVVPTEEVFADPEGDLEVLESAAAADPTKKIDLLRRLQSMCDSLKAELRDLLPRHGIRQFVMKPVKRSYAFETPGVPHGSQYVLKVKYPAVLPQLPSGLTGSTFRAIFGSNQSMLEALMLKRRVKGPSWLLLRAASRVEFENQFTWSKIEVVVASPKDVTSDTAAESAARPGAPMVVASLSLKTLLNPNTQQHEVAAVGVVYVRAMDMEAGGAREVWNRPQVLRNFSVVRKLNNMPWPAGFEKLAATENASPRGVANGGNMVSLQESERSLLTCLLAKLQALDADVFVGHNIGAFDLSVLLHRMQHHKVPLWSRIGRLKRREFPKLTGGGNAFGGGASHGVMSIMAGRLLCDTYVSARELVREVDYSLKTLSASLLSETREELVAADLPARYDNGEALLGMLRHAEGDAWLAMGIATHLSVLPLSRALASLTGSLWGRALAGQRAQRIEMLLLHDFHSRKFILPDKMSFKDRDRQAREKEWEDPGEEEEGAVGGGGKKGSGGGGKKDKGPQYAGGLVLEPKKGLYEKIVLLLDFNSLYPSIIQEFNICFTTVSRPADGSGGIPPLPAGAAGGQLAPLPMVIQGLVQRRRAVKAAMSSARDTTTRQQLDIRQQALKLTANSMYGCLGFTHSRFYAKPLAELITSQGRSILQSTVDLVQGQLSMEVIYGDTDSIMIFTGSDSVAAAREAGARVKKEVNRRYKLLEIELDGLYKCMLLLKKKKYAAIKLEAGGPNGTMTEVMEQKGLDIVRRDWSPLSKDVGNFVLAQILSGRGREDVVTAIHAHLREVAAAVQAGQVSLGKFIITKQLTKRPEDYPDAKGQPHVQVALRRKAAGKRDSCSVGETVPYIICIEVPSTSTPMQQSTPSNGSNVIMEDHALSITAAADGSTTPTPAATAGAGAAAAAATATGDAAAAAASEAPSTSGRPTVGGAAATASAKIGAKSASKGGKGSAKAAAAAGGNGGGGGLADRAYHPDELRQREDLRVDVEYYLANQVHPVVSRLCAPIEGTSAAHIAECLGLDPNRFRGGGGGGSGATGGAAPEEDLMATAGSMMDDDDSFKDCTPLHLLARNGTSFEFRGVGAVLQGATTADALFTPPDAVGDEGQKLNAIQLTNQVLLRCREAITAYYDGHLTSDDDLSRLATRNAVLRPISSAEGGTTEPSPQCCAHPDASKSGALLRRQVSERQLYLQLSYYYRLLDVEGAVGRRVRQLKATDPKSHPRAAEVSAALPEDLCQTLAVAAEAVAALRGSSEYHWVDLQALFAPLLAKA